MTRRKVVGTTTITAGVVCRSLELMTALGMMEGHNRLLPATESRSGLMNVAMRNRGVLVLACVLVALSSLLCVGKESQAKQPGKAPKPGSPATSHQPPSHRPAGAPHADQRAPAAQQKPAPRGPVDHRGPSSRPKHQRPTRTQPAQQRPAEHRPAERAAPAGRRAHDQGRPTESPGKQPAPHERPTHEQRPAHEQRPLHEQKPVHEKPIPEPKQAHEKKPVHEPRPAHEPPGFQKFGREPGPHKAVGQDHIRYRPQPEKVARDPSSRPVHERPAPQTTPHYPHGKWSTGRQEGVESPDLPGKPASLPGGENVHPEKKRSIAQPEQARQRPEYGMAAGHKPDKKAGSRDYRSATPKEKSPVYKNPTHMGTSADAPDGRSPGMVSVGAKEPLDRQPPARTSAGYETASGAEPSYRKADTEGGKFGPRSVDLRKEEPTGLTGPSSAQPPERQAVETFQTKSSQTVDSERKRDAVPYEAPGGQQRGVGELAQLASGPLVGPTRLDSSGEKSSLVDLIQEALRAMPGGPHNLSKAILYTGNLTQRGPPLEIPSPFFGFVSMMVGAASGSGFSGNGVAPLLAVIAPCLIILLYRGRSHIFCDFLRPVMVPRPALERPG
jgi:hypothetical protein